MYTPRKIIILLLLISLIKLTVTPSQSLPNQTLPKENHQLFSRRNLKQDDSVYCQSWRLAVETNNAGSFQGIPSRCHEYVKNYMTGVSYSSDTEVVAKYSLEFAKSVQIAADGKDAWVFDVDETLLNHLSFVEACNFSLKVEKANVKEWMLKAKAPALRSSLRVYKGVQQLGFKVFILTGRSQVTYWNATVENLRRAGYDNWERLILRGPFDLDKLSVEFKSEKRKELQDEGYRIQGNTGDQWSDLLGYAVAKRSFKVPNPMYYTA